MARVLIADTHAVSRAGVRRFFDMEAAITAVGEAATGDETLALLSAEPWDLLLLDIHLPDCQGLGILPRVHAEYPALQILVMGGLPEELYARDVVRAGAGGYLSKGSPPEELLKAVRTVLAKRRYVSESLAEIMAGDLDGDHDQPLHTRLSAREYQIFCRLASGIGISKISVELGLSVKTVSTYRSRILEKMTFKSNASMTAYALRNGIIQ